MIRTHTNSTQRNQVIYDGWGDPIRIAPGQTVSYIDRATFKDFGTLISAEEEDANGNLLFIGWAQVGTARNQPGWIIKRRIVAGNRAFYAYSGGHADFRHRWDLRRRYQYS